MRMTRTTPLLNRARRRLLASVLVPICCGKVKRRSCVLVMASAVVPRVTVDAAVRTDARHAKHAALNKAPAARAGYLFASAARARHVLKVPSNHRCYAATVRGWWRAVPFSLGSHLMDIGENRTHIKCQIHGQTRPPLTRPCRLPTLSTYVEYPPEI